MTVTLETAKRIFDDAQNTPAKEVARKFSTSLQVVHMIAGGFVPPFQYQNLEASRGSTCDCCGMAIKAKAWFSDAQSTKFKVGVDCAKKLDGSISDFCRLDQDITEHNRQKNAECRAKRVAKEKQVLDSFELILRSGGEFDSQPHPKQWVGKTLADYLKWVYPRCGHSGQVRLVKQYAPHLFE